MRKLEPTEHYERLMIRAHGKADAEVYGSLAFRWKHYGVHPYCAECAAAGRCKDRVAGVPGDSEIFCSMKKIIAGCK